MDFIYEILSSDYLKINNAERSEFLKKKAQESNEIVYNI